jgi:hypothetical protein
MRCLQVLVWKTNFDPPCVDSKLCAKTKVERPRPHTHDHPKQNHMTSERHAHHFDAARGPVNNVSPPPRVVNVAPRLFHRSEPTATPNGLPASNTAPLERVAMSPQVANTLEHIVGQLDILTQVYMGGELVATPQHPGAHREAAGHTDMRHFSCRRATINDSARCHG